MTKALSPRRQKLLEQLVILRIRRKTFAECAAELGVSERTLKYWARSSEFTDRFASLQQEWQDNAKALVSLWGDQVLAEMLRLGVAAKSEMVRFHALKALGDWMGLGQEQKREQDASKEELIELYELLRNQERQLTVDVRHWLPQPGGTKQLPVETLDAPVDVEHRVLGDS